MNKRIAIVLAAGKGTRMGGSVVKTMRVLACKPLIFWTLSLLDKLKIPSIVVTGFQEDLVKSYIRKVGFKVTFTSQNKLLGTGDAVKKALKLIPAKYNTVIVVFADDSSLYTKKTITGLISFYEKKGKPGTLLVHSAKVPQFLGGLERDKQNNVIGVLTKDELIKRGVKKIEEVCGIFIFDRKWLEDNIKLINKNPNSGEYHLPSLISIAAISKNYFKTMNLAHEIEWQSINTEGDLKKAEEKKKLILKKWQRE